MRTILLAIGAAAGYMAARTLLERETPPEALPAPAQEWARRAQHQLRGWRALAADAIREGQAARDDAARDLQADYLHRTHRDRPSRP